jgi:exopolyphosphatase / guanosine-5'-triphosphate,3'-diphosphate pyrophosphatase
MGTVFHRVQKMTETLETGNAPRMVAVIDIGATSIRLTTGQIRPDGSIEFLDTLANPVRLGRDSFSSGVIRRSTIEECVDILNIYKTELETYGVSFARDVRVVATSAVREATNSVAFLDRVFIGTGLNIEPFDESRLHRVTYLGIRPLLDKYPQLCAGQTVICEVGGGSTETLVLTDGQITTAQTWRLGALRLVLSLEAGIPRGARSRHLLESRIAPNIRQLQSALDPQSPRNLVLLGSEMRRCVKVMRGNEVTELEFIEQEELDEFIQQSMTLSVDRLVPEHNLSVQEAESFVAALVINHMVAAGAGVEQIGVARGNMREGMIREMTFGPEWVLNTVEQIERNALRLGERFGFDRGHASHVARLAGLLFRETASLHQLPQQSGIILHLAALLHETGLSINERSYHKHSAYIIANSSLVGVSGRELLLTSLVARYHRRALPQIGHEGYTELSQVDRVEVSKLAALLRTAKALDAGRKGKITSFRTSLNSNSLVIEVPDVVDLTLEQVELRRQQELFAYVFGRNVELIHAVGEN